MYLEERLEAGVGGLGALGRLEERAEQVDLQEAPGRAQLEVPLRQPHLHNKAWFRFPQTWTGSRGTRSGRSFMAPFLASFRTFCLLVATFRTFCQLSAHQAT